MSKDVIVNNEEYKGVSVIQLKTASGVAQFKDIDEATGGGLNFAEKASIDVSEGANKSYWRAYKDSTSAYIPAHEYGIIIVDFVGTHLGAESVNGIQTQLFVYAPGVYRYIGWGYRSGNGAQVDSRIDGVRNEGESIQTIEAAIGNGNMYTGYIPGSATIAVFKEAELTKEIADILIPIMSGAAGYTAP